MLTVYGRRNSFNVQKVMWLVGELGIEYAHVPLGGDAGGLDDPAFLAKNPHGKVPLIDDDGTNVWESHAILRYLAAVYGDRHWWSTDPEVRSHVDRWMDWSQSTLQPSFLNGIFWAYFRTPAERRDMKRVEDAIKRTNGYMQRLDAHLADRTFMLGSRLTLADIPIGTHLYRYFNLDIPRPALPHVEAWYRRLQERAPYQQHVMMPFDDLAGRLAF